jgi:hypothetical protein
LSTRIGDNQQRTRSGDMAFLEISDIFAPIHANLRQEEEFYLSNKQRPILNDQQLDFLVTKKFKQIKLINICNTLLSSKKVY